jgi:hypothetical protein
VLLGEIRDHETAQIAIEAALTGHLVLSTLHTNDAPERDHPLIEMDIEPFLVGSALDCRGRPASRAALCDRCKEPYSTPPRGPRQPARRVDPRPCAADAVQAGGCTACSNTGYRGRVALHEVMAVSEDIERLAVARASSAEIGRLASRAGDVDLREDGWAKAQIGVTSIEEILRWSRERPSSTARTRGGDLMGKPIYEIPVTDPAAPPFGAPASRGAMPPPRGATAAARPDQPDDGPVVARAAAGPPVPPGAGGACRAGSCSGPVSAGTGSGSTVVIPPPLHPRPHPPPRPSATPARVGSRLHAGAERAR